jgi:hypothetical protein
VQFGELVTGFFQEQREGLALLWINASGELRFKALYVFACDEILQVRFPVRFDPSSSIIG